MIQINVDPTLQAQLADLAVPAELRDQSGNTLAFVLSPGEYERFLEMEKELRRQDYEWAKAAVTDEELDAAMAVAEAENVWFTHDEMMDHLRRLEEQERS